MWLAPLFLIGLAGLGLPIWLHRFARKTEQKQPFASLMFLEASEIRRSRRHELRYWLLLLLRLLLVALVVLAFAGPLWRTAVKPGAKGAALHVVVVDTSLSMNYTGLWERAQKRASELIGAVHGGDRVMLVAADYRLRVMHEPVFAGDTGALRAALQSLTPGNSRLDYGALAAGSAAWTGAPGEHVLVHLVSDLQRTGSPLRFADLQLPPGVQLDLVDVGDKDAVNLRVADVQLAERGGNQVLVRVDGDAKALAGRTLVLEINGKESGRKPLDAHAMLPLTQRFDIADLGPGEHRLAAHLIPADGLPQDDAFFALVRRVQPKVLLIAASPTGDDATYLRAALQSLENPHFDVEAAPVSALLKRALPEFAAIVVSDAGLLDAAAAGALRKYVEGGGAALMTLGPRMLQQRVVPLSGAKLAGGSARADADKPARVAEVEQSHPVLRDPGAWRSIRFFRHVPVQAPEDARVLLRFENDTPLLFEQSLQKGRLLTFASPLDREWNDLAIHPLFVRFVAEATAYLAGARALPATGIVGTTFESDLARRGGGAVFDPAGKRTIMLDGTQGGPRLVPELPGYYEVRGGGRSDFIAVNVDARESQLAALDPDARQRWLALQRPAAVDVSQAAAGARERRIEVWFWLLLAALALAFLEPLVANYHLPVLRERRT